MVKISGSYEGELRCRLIHEPSQNLLETDAPIDNQGKGMRYSPTDLLAAGLASCMLTIMGIRANSKNINLGYPTFKAEKIMQSNPRRISIIKIVFFLPIGLTENERRYLENEARKCPVALSLSSEISQDISFEYA